MPVIMWFIIKSIYLILVPISDTELLKPLEFPRWWEGGNFQVEPKDAGWLPREPTTWLEGWNFQSNLLTSGKWHRERLEVKSITNGQGLPNLAYVMKPSKNPKRTAFRECLGWWSMEIQGKWYIQKRHRISEPSQYLALCISSTWLFLSYIFL